MNDEELFKNAMECLDSKQFLKGIEYLEKCAEQGHTKSKEMLAYIYYSGKIVQANPEKAFYYYKILADQGSETAQCMVGYFFQVGYSTERNFQESIKYYKKAAEQGNATAQNNLGNFYQHGIGIERDYKKAIYYYTQAAEQENDGAQNNLGNCYRLGIGVEKNPEKAFELYEQAAKQGKSEAIFNLANCYLKGIGVKKNPQKAVEYYSRESNRYHAESVLYLAMCYCNGLGVEKNYRKALEILLKEKKIQLINNETRANYISLLLLLKDIKSNEEILEIESIAELPPKLDNKIKLVRIATTRQQKHVTMNNGTVNGLYPIETIYKCKLEIDKILKKIDLVKPDKSNELEVFMQIYVELGKNIQYLEDVNNLYKLSNMEGAVLERHALCVGISETIRNILAYRGIKCECIPAYRHAYNQVCLSGKWYYIDLTNDMTAIKNKEKLKNCLLSKNDFEEVFPIYHIDEDKDNYPSNESYNQQVVENIYNKVLEMQKSER